MQPVVNIFPRVTTPVKTSSSKVPKLVVTPSRRSDRIQCLPAPSYIQQPTPALGDKKTPKKSLGVIECHDCNHWNRQGPKKLNVQVTIRSPACVPEVYSAYDVRNNCYCWALLGEEGSVGIVRVLAMYHV